MRDAPAPAALYVMAQPDGPTALRVAFRLVSYGGQPTVADGTTQLTITAADTGAPEVLISRPPGSGARTLRQTC